jgi:putative ABC transport system permease protein
VLSANQPQQGQPGVQVNGNGQVVPAKNQPVQSAPPPQLATSAAQIAKSLGAQLIPLETTNAGIVTIGTQGGRSWNGAVYVATPRLLRAFGITTSEIEPNADILSSRPGLAGVSGLGLDYASGGTCTAAAGCVVDPVIQEVGALPSGVSAPNTVITEHAIRKFHLQTSTSDWLIQGPQPFTAAQISSAELAASTTQVSVEAKNDQPTSSAVITSATIFGIVIALGVLGMSVGLVRSETASDLRTLAATGASSYTRRTLTAVTAGALGFLGALLGVVGGYIGMIGWLRSNSLNGGIAALGNIPVADLLLILLGMPAFAAIVGWLFAGREPAAMAHQAIE